MTPRLGWAAARAARAGPSRRGWLSTGPPTRRSGPSRSRAARAGRAPRPRIPGAAALPRGAPGGRGRAPPQRPTPGLVPPLAAAPERAAEVRRLAELKRGPPARLDAGRVDVAAEAAGAPEARRRPADGDGARDGQQDAEPEGPDRAVALASVAPLAAGAGAAAGHSRTPAKGQATRPGTWLTRAAWLVSAPTPGTVLCAWQTRTGLPAVAEDVPANEVPEACYGRNLDAHPVPVWQEWRDVSSAHAPPTPSACESRSTRAAS